MKKLITFLFLIVTFLTVNITISANEVEFKNIINSDSRLEDDFKNLNLDVNDYIVTDNSLFKFFVVGYAEEILNSIGTQSYVYLYQPHPYDYTNLEEIRLFYNINDVDYSYTISSNHIDFYQNHGLFKLKAFSYPMLTNAKIKFSKIEYVELRETINTDEYEEVVTSFDSNFECDVVHENTNDSIKISMNFDSVIVLEEYAAYQVVVHSEDSPNWVEELFSTKSNPFFRVYFYNFNFPEKYKNTDKVYKAVFSYDLIKYEAVYERDSISSDNYSGLVEYTEEKVPIVEEYTEKSNTIQVDDKSQVLDMPTFYLGNRITDKQFGSINMDYFEANFDYDCSVLLGAYLDDSYKYGIANKYSHHEGQKIDNIEMLELHFHCDDRDYSCQVVSEPIDPTPIVPPNTPKYNWFQKLLLAIANFLIELVGIKTSIVPDTIKYAIGFVGLFFILVIAILLLILLIKIYKKIKVHLGNFIIYFFKTIKKIITAPFRLFKRN